MKGLLTELSGLSHWNDELMTAKESDMVVIRDLDVQLKGYKCRYEQAKTELWSVIGTFLARYLWAIIYLFYSILFVFSDISTILTSSKAQRPAYSRSRWRPFRHPHNSICIRH